MLGKMSKIQHEYWASITFQSDTNLMDGLPDCVSP